MTPEEQKIFDASAASIDSSPGWKEAAEKARQENIQKTNKFLKQEILPEIPPIVASFLIPEYAAVTKGLPFVKGALNVMKAAGQTVVGSVPVLATGQTLKQIVKHNTGQDIDMLDVLKDTATQAGLAGAGRLFVEPLAKVGATVQKGARQLAKTPDTPVRTAEIKAMDILSTGRSSIGKASAVAPELLGKVPFLGAPFRGVTKVSGLPADFNFESMAVPAGGMQITPAQVESVRRMIASNPKDFISILDEFPDEIRIQFLKYVLPKLGGISGEIKSNKNDLPKILSASLRRVEMATEKPYTSNSTAKVGVE